MVLESETPILIGAGFAGGCSGGGWFGGGGGASGGGAFSTIFCGTGFGGERVDGVHVYAPDGAKLGQILMPEGTANLCFIGKHRNRLFMASSQSVYTLYTAAQGAHIT